MLFDLCCKHKKNAILEIAQGPTLGRTGSVLSLYTSFSLLNLQLWLSSRRLRVFFFFVLIMLFYTFDLDYID